MRLRQAGPDPEAWLRPTVVRKASSRADLVAGYRQLIDAGLGTGSSGNLSLRDSDGMLITPTGVTSARLQVQDVVAMSLDGQVAAGQLRPSSEWHMHAAIYRARPDVNAVVHCHSRYATILACAHRPIPAIHYMIAITAVDEIPVAPYATFGSDALAQATTATLGQGRACLLANHGQIAAGEDLSQALSVAQEVEELAVIYWGSLALGGGEILSPSAMLEVHTAFATYGQQQGDQSGEHDA
ncbi:MAG: class II aldolase/adducin family protein [Halioglobus sp.]